MADVTSLFGTDKSRRMIIEDPITGEAFKNDEGKEMAILLQSKDSPECKRVIASFRDKYKKGKTPSFAASEKFAIDLLAAATTGFESIQSGGKELKYSSDAAKELYKSSSVIRGQVDEFLGEEENFIQSVLAA